MPTISISRDYSTSKNLKMYIISMCESALFNTGELAKIDLKDGLNGLPKRSSIGQNMVYYYNYVPNLQEIPELISGNSSGSTDTIEITTLADAYHEYADGLKNYSDGEGSNTLTFTFLYDKDCYNALQEQINFIQSIRPDYDASLYYQIAVIVLPDGSYFAMRFKDMATTFAGVGVNSALTFQLTFTLDGGVYWNNGSSALPSITQFAGVLKLGSSETLNNSESVKRLTTDDGTHWINHS